MWVNIHVYSRDNVRLYPHVAVQYRCDGGGLAVMKLDPPAGPIVGIILFVVGGGITWLLLRTIKAAW
jgi:hypothetical protein